MKFTLTNLEPCFPTVLKLIGKCSSGVEWSRVEWSVLEYGIGIGVNILFIKHISILT